MTNEDINKYLTEAMGECWHEPLPDMSTWSSREHCKKCNKIVAVKFNSRSFVTNNFFTWEGFGKLWGWAIEQEWWNMFIYQWTDDYVGFEIPCSLINPARFAKAIHEYLKER
ncbi:hypothetical protein KAR91_41640 [Candidatus Pacearchaeota archaeon]|nr:hypothetical protein [Candidatus Pacearchaeota archaeon]